MSFVIVFPTQPSFLRSYFAPMRGVLVGSIIIENIKEPEVLSTEALPQVSTRAKSRKAAKKLRSTISWLSMALAAMVLVIFLGPGLYFYFFPADVTPVQALEQGSVLGGRYETGTSVTKKDEWQPPVDTSLPAGSWISIPKIGVRTELKQTVDSEEALREGVWWVPDFGTAGDREKPMIVAAHRYGYQWWWKSEYWRYHSFYLLPDLKPGDVVEVIHEQRKWTYEIYAGEEGDEISDYSADLILYTCKFLNSPVRHFRYARLVNTQQDSQEAAQKLTTS